MNDRELMQMALDALEYIATQTRPVYSAEKAIEALRARLAQPEPEADVCCQDFRNCLRSCTPRGQWIAHVRCGCGDQIMPDDGAECGNCVTARNAVKPQPVAQVHVAEDYYPHVIWAEGINAACFDQEYLYITPPQREWQGLTDEEMQLIAFSRAIEAKLKEKNNG